MVELELMKLSFIKLASGQKDKLSDFFVTVAAGWFGAAVVTPFFFPPQTLVLSFIGRIIVGIVLAGVCLSFSLKIVKKGKS